MLRRTACTRGGAAAGDPHRYSERAQRIRRQEFFFRQLRRLIIPGFLAYGLFIARPQRGTSSATWRSGATTTRPSTGSSLRCRQGIPMSERQGRGARRAEATPGGGGSVLCGGRRVVVVAARSRMTKPDWRAGVCCLRGNVRTLRLTAAKCFVPLTRRSGLLSWRHGRSIHRCIF
ncbi:hypothetical protein C4B63_52g139 [Trypanosoma cruzi]|uniref:Uncharacterized protein n=1 Tax=Trypanosoma cruzi TaxID=5693 RepID=A0A2V2V1Z2_TRYCR|nr:hypothetical protein C4B63_52g139 [Trypanosoma cruzi]